MRRVGAVLGAIVMIVVALLVRDLVIDGDDGSGGGGAGPLRLVCSSEVRTTCEQLADEDGDVEVTVAAAGTTAAELADPSFRGADGPYDAWVVLEPLPALVDLEREASGEAPSLLEAEALASSRLALVAANDRAEALLAACGDDEDERAVRTRCLGDAAGGSWEAAGGQAGWGSMRLGFVDPATRAEGQAALGSLATGFFATTDPPLGADEYASNDFQPLGLTTWLGQVADGIDTSSSGGTPLERLVQRGPATFGAVLTLEATADQAITGTRAEDDLTVLYPSPMATAVVALAPVAGADGADSVDELADPLREALAATGWDVDDPQPAGLPRPGVADALDRLWSQVS